MLRLNYGLLLVGSLALGSIKIQIGILIRENVILQYFVFETVLSDAFSFLLSPLHLSVLALI